MSLKERRVEVEAGEQMTPDEFRRWVIEPVTKALSNNENRKQAKAARTARYRAASRRMERYDT